MRVRGVRVGWVCAAALCLAAALGAPSATTGCVTHQCDGSFVDGNALGLGDFQEFGGGDGGLAVWESNPFNGTWLDYPPFRTYFFGLPKNFHPEQPSPYVSTTPNPNDVSSGGSGSFVSAGGQLALMSNFDVNNGFYVPSDGAPPPVNGFLITNGTCAHYYLYVTISGTWMDTAPVAGPPAVDAGNDAGTDASNEATDAPMDTSGDDDFGD